MRTALELVTAKLEQLDAARPLPAEVVEQLADWYELELTFTGLRLDGVRLTREQTAQALVPGNQVPGIAAEVQQAALSLRDALQLVGGLSYAGTGALSERTIKELHRALRRGLDPEAGRYRSGPIIPNLQNGTVDPERAAILPQASRIPMLMAGVGTWLETVEPSPEAAFEVHYRLVRIMPFAEGNHAVARLAMNLLLGRAGYPPVVIAPDNAFDYLDCLDIALTEGDKTCWRNLLLEYLEQSLDLCLDAAAQAAEGTAADR